jgi:hypothetical protein
MCLETAELCWNMDNYVKHESTRQLCSVTCFLTTAADDRVHDVSADVGSSHVQLPRGALTRRDGMEAAWHNTAGATHWHQPASRRQQAALLSESALCASPIVHLDKQVTCAN